MISVFYRSIYIIYLRIRVSSLKLSTPQIFGTRVRVRGKKKFFKIHPPPIVRIRQKRTHLFVATTSSSSRGGAITYVRCKRERQLKDDLNRAPLLADRLIVDCRPPSIVFQAVVDFPSTVMSVGLSQVCLHDYYTNTRTLLIKEASMSIFLRFSSDFFSKFQQILLETNTFFFCNFPRILSTVPQSLIDILSIFLQILQIFFEVLRRVLIKLQSKFAQISILVYLKIFSQISVLFLNVF